MPEAFALVREAAQRTLKMRHFDVQLVGGIALHQGKIAEMRTGEGKTLVATLAVYSERADRQRRSHRHGQRVSRAARRGLDGADLPVPRPRGRRHQEQSADRREAPRLPCRYHLRHEQRVRLRLSARQPRVPARGSRAAQARLCDRRRGRLDPDRRGAHAADHLRPLGGEYRALRADQSLDPAAQAARPAARQGERRDRVDTGRADRAQGRVPRHDVDGGGASQGEGARPARDRGRRVG